MARSVTRTAPSGGVLKRILVGRAVESARLEHTLLPKILALPVFSSDALSSVAYATEEILLVLLTASAASKSLAFPIAIAISTLMVIVIASYRQTVRAYPNGGGAYIVSRENLGVYPGLIAASALLVDYMMTVVVSTVAGVVAITSALPSLTPHKVALAIGFVLLITLANLRGVRESGTVFAVPTYGFIVAIFVMVTLGLVQCLGGCPTAAPVEAIPGLAAAGGAVGLWVILRAFSSGSTALTGVEAISNGVSAFRRPQARNAAETLVLMGVIAISMFLGISWLATHIDGITVSEHRSVVAQIADTVFGGGLGFYLVQGFTAAILVLAANTAFQDFPRLSAILARDHYMPRQFMNRGDRLVFSNGVIGLGLAACLVIYAFDADLTRLIQMYVVGVFTSFTLSQTGMVRHWLAERRRGPEAARGWQRAIAINTVGAITTGVVLVVITATKFAHGAWLSILVMALIVPLLRSIHRHYTSVQGQLRRGVVDLGVPSRNHVVILVQRLDAAAVDAISYVKSIRHADVRAVHPSRTGTIARDMAERWRRLAEDIPLEPIAHREPLRTIRTFVRAIPRDPDDFVTVIVPEAIHGRLLSYLLHRRDLIRLKAGLLREPNVVVTDIPVVVEGDLGDAGAEPLLPGRSVTLVFVSAVHDATIRAVNYAVSLGAQETRAITFELDPEGAVGIERDWFDRRLPIPLDVVEAPFRDLTGPMLEEVRRFTLRGDTIVTVVLPEFVVSRWRYLLLHNQNALFVKRLLLFEPNAVLSSVPFVLHSDERDTAPSGAEA